ncbi:MAG: C1 family peptidase [Ferruginibacter sp.]
MPIRMVDDPDGQNDYKENTNDNSGGGGFPGGGGGGGMLAFLPLILSLFRGKKIILLLIIAAGAYFLFFRNSGTSGGAGIIKNLFSKSGYNYDSSTFKKANVYEGLEADNTKNPLPEAVSLLKYAPDRKNQGQQGSCVAWSSVYAARTIVEAASTGQSGNSTAFSPAFVYNQIGLEDCQGSYIEKAMEFMTAKGVVPFNDFPYTDQECSRQPSSSLWNEAAGNKMHGFTRLTDGVNADNISIRAIKEHLAKDAPVVIGMMVGGTFMQDMMGKDTWSPNSSDMNMEGYGGHAMCVIGYNDSRQAFQVMNSWGPEWGDNGTAWIKYADFKNFVREAYGIDPMPKRGAALNVSFECTVGLMADSKQYIPLKIISGNIFETVNKIAPGTKFKLEIKNSIECYTYIFGQETDGSSYTLFPYPDPSAPTKTSFSPYCGITGYRLFPRGKSMAPDNVGTKDVFAIVVTKQPLDWFAVNGSISKSSQADFGSKIADALRGSVISNVNFATGNGGTINFKTDNTQQNAVVAVVEVNK